MGKLDTLKALEAAATAGPWEVSLPGPDGPDAHARWGRVHKYEVRDGTLHADHDIVEVAEHDEHDDDLRLIAAARNALPALIAVAEAGEEVEKYATPDGDYVRVERTSYNVLLRALRALEQEREGE